MSANSMDASVRTALLPKINRLKMSSLPRSCERNAVRGQVLGMSRWIWKNVMPQGEVAFLRRLQRELDQSRRLYVPRFGLA